MNDAITMLQKAVREKFWGQLQIDFHNGEIILIRKTETIKPKGNTREHEFGNRN